MAQQIDYDPTTTGSDLKIPGFRDAATTAARSALAAGESLADGLFGLFEGVFSGTSPAGHRLLQMVVSGSTTMTNTLSGILSILGDVDDANNTAVGQLGALRNLIYERFSGNTVEALWLADLAGTFSTGYRKILGIDAGAYTNPAALATTINYTGVNLNGRTAGLVFDRTNMKKYRILSVTDPVPPAAGVITIYGGFAAASTQLIIPYSDVPHSYDTATDADRGILVAAPPPAVNGPAVLLSSAALAEVAGTYNLDVYVANYDLITVQAFWDAAAGDTYQFNLWARIDDQPAGDWTNINAWFNVAGTALGAAVDPGQFIARISTRTKLRELRVERIKVNNNGNAIMRVWIMEGR